MSLRSIAALLVLGSLAGVACGGSAGTEIEDLSTPSASTPDPDGGSSTAPDGAPLPPDGDSGVTLPDGGKVPDISGGRGDSCEASTRINAKSITLRGQTTVGYQRKYVGCFGMRGRDRIYSTVVPPGERLRARVTSTQPGYEPEIHIVAGPAIECSGNPLACLDDSVSGQWLMWWNKDPVSREIFLIVDSDDDQDPGGSFDLDVHIETSPAGDTCKTAPKIAITPGTPTVLANESTALYTDDYSYSAGRGDVGCDFSGPERVYTVDVPAGQNLIAEVTPVGDLTTHINFLVDQPGTCDSKLECLSAARSPKTGDKTRGELPNRTGASRRVHVAVGVRGLVNNRYSAGGPYSLSLSLQPVSTKPGESCVDPVVLTPDTLLDSETTVGYDDDFGRSSLRTKSCRSNGPDKVYRVAVPAGKQLQVAAVPTTPNFDLSMDAMVEAPGVCAALERSCVATSRTKFGEPGRTLTWENDTGAEVNLLVNVSGDTSLIRDEIVSGAFTIQASLTDP